MRYAIVLFFVFVCALTLFGQTFPGLNEPISPFELRSLTARANEAARGSRVGPVQLTPAKIEDLAALGKVWGFLKYHHPAVASGAYDWDAELLKVMPDILAANSAMERNSVLSQWVDSLGNVQLAPAAPDPPSLKLAADTSWIKPATFGARLAKQLTLVKNAARTTLNFYVAFPTNNPVFQNENSYPSMTYPDPRYQLLALYRFWNIIQYFFPNRHLTGENWNAVMTEYVPRFYTAKNELEYKKTALSLIGRMHDTHSNILNIDPILEQDKGLYAAAVRVRFVENKAVVTEYWNDMLGRQTGMLPGDVIEFMDGKSVADIVGERREFTPASNDVVQLRDISVNILRTNAPSINVMYRRDGIMASASLRTYPWQTTLDRNLIYHRPIPPFRMIGSDIAYLYPGSLQNEEINTYIPSMKGTRGLIIDWRSYPLAFDTIFYLGNYLLDKPVPFVKFSKGSIIAPGRFNYINLSNIGNFTGNPIYTGKVVILVNEITQSSGEFHSMAFRAVPGAIVIGSTTAGADGNVSDFTLPGGIRSRISGIGVYYPDGTETQRIGIVPDIVKEPTIQGIKNGRDEVLERAIEYINAN